MSISASDANLIGLLKVMVLALHLQPLDAAGFRLLLFPALGTLLDEALGVLGYLLVKFCLCHLVSLVERPWPHD